MIIIETIIICFTGHRPNKLGGYDWNSDRNQVIMGSLTAIIKKLLDNNNKRFHFICGGALGIDQMAFHICNDLKSIYKDRIFIEIAIPFLFQFENWNSESRELYFSQINIADDLTYVDSTPGYENPKLARSIYYPEKMQIRNQYMVDKSTCVIGVWGGSNGGTQNCINYAISKSKKLIILDPNTLKISIQNNNINE